MSCNFTNEGMTFRITEDNQVELDGKLIGDFYEIQQQICDSDMALVQRYKIKAIYTGGNTFRYIADWEGIIVDYHIERKLI